MRIQCVVAISMLTCLPLNVEAKDLFLVHADGPTVHADYAAGNPQASPIPTNSYTLTKTTENAKWGRAISLVRGNDRCTYDGTDNLNSAKGTVDFWFRIQSHEEGDYHPLFGWYRPPQKPGAQTRLSAFELYYQNDVFTFGLYTPDHTDKYKGYSVKAAWTKDQWHHLEFNWDCANGNGESFYNAFLDGKKFLSIENAGALNGNGGKLHVGVWDYAFFHTLRGQIDELRITDQIEHLRDFTPPDTAYALPFTLARAKQSLEVALERQIKLRGDIDLLLQLSGEQASGKAGSVLRTSVDTAKIAKIKLAELQKSLSDKDSNPKALCTAADSLIGEINAARISMFRISEEARKIAEIEDRRSMLFKSINEELIADATIIDGKQLFFDALLIQDLSGVPRKLNQPVKHPNNPLVIPDLPWEKEGFYANGSVIYDAQEKLFKVWLHIWEFVGDELASTRGHGLYMTSIDGINWKKPIINKDENNNHYMPPSGALSFGGQGIIKDMDDSDPTRRYKMIYTSTPPGKPHAYETGVAYSPDGIHWTAEPANPVIPFGDTQAAPFWDSKRQSYLGFVRTGPPNVRGIARIESKDFIHWSPKLTIFPAGGTNLDRPFRSLPYGMKVMSYHGYYISFLNMYHWETISPIPDDMLFQDKTNVYLGYSRNGITWNRVGPGGEITQQEMQQDRDWRKISNDSVFIPYGEHKKEWDWGQVYAYHAPVVHDDKIWIYYTGLASRHWSNYHGDDRPPKTGMGLATLRLDGFVSVDANADGWLLTKPIVAIGDTLVLNADAEGGSIRVEAIDALGRVIPEFSKASCIPITSDGLRHIVKWKQGADCNALQGRPIQLKIYMDKAKLYSLEFKTTLNHYIP